MAKMNDDDLLKTLQNLESDASHYTFGALRQQREAAVRDYQQRPYGNEEEGWSQIVTSDVQDTIEWILPELLDIFVSSEDAVVFDPTRAADAQGAEQATDTCNYVFYKQNNGFLTLYTLFKDALMLKNGAVHWRKETKRSVEKMPLRGVDAMQLEFAVSQGWELPKDVEALPVQAVLDPVSGAPIPGPQLFNALMTRPLERKTIRVDAFDPETLNVKRDWTSPMLDDCPYVARTLYVSLSDLKEMGFKVDAEDLAGSSMPAGGTNSTPVTSNGREDSMYADKAEGDSDDESLTMGYLRIEWVLADRDGDGIAERLEIFRLEDKILSVEECAQVPIATGSPILVQHRWDGMSVAETVADLQLLRTEIMRQVVNNAYLANNPRKVVQTDTNGAPYVNTADLLDGRPGGIIQTKKMDALGMDVMPFVGGQMFGMMEYIDNMREQRTGVSKQQQGLDPNALRPDRTAQEVVMTANAAKQRVKLIARIFAETLVKPIFKGILRLLTEGDMDKIAYRLRGQFVEVDPNEWRDNYDMTTNVGLGTGDKEKQLAVLNAMGTKQLQLAASPLGAMLVKPQQIYRTQQKMLDIAGFKNADDFFINPGDQPLPQPPPPAPPYQIAVKQMELQAEQGRVQLDYEMDRQKFQAEAELKQREVQLQFEKEAQNDQRDFERWQWEAQSAERIKLAEIEAKLQESAERNRTSIIVARIAHPETNLTDLDIDPLTGETFAKVDPLPGLLQGVQAIAAQQVAPKLIIRDAAGKVAGVQSGDVVQSVVRDESGRVTGLQ